MITEGQMSSFVGNEFDMNFHLAFSRLPSLTTRRGGSAGGGGGGGGSSSSSSSSCSSSSTFI